MNFLPLSSFGAYLPRYTVIPLTSDRPADRVNNSTNPPFPPHLVQTCIVPRWYTDTYTKEKGGKKEKEGSGEGEEVMMGLFRV